MLGELSGQVSASSFAVLYQRGIEGANRCQGGRRAGPDIPRQVPFRYHRLRQKFRGLFGRSVDRDLFEGDKAEDENGRTNQIRAQQNGASCD